MKYTYKIIYDIDSDMWNWRDSLKSPFMGFTWRDNVKLKEDLVIVNKIINLNKKEAEKILKPYLLKQRNNSDSRLNKFLDLAEKDLKDKFQDACEVLEKITKKPIMSSHFDFFVTTFPRMPFFYDRKEIFMYCSTEDYWGMPTDGFLHEGLHFQFMYYWQADKKSPVSKLNQEEFDYLKEALTVVLDEDLKPVITVPDRGYPNQVAFRDELHDFWKKTNDFDKLVNFGLKRLPDFIIMDKITIRKLQLSDKSFFAKWWRDKELLSLTSGDMNIISDKEVDEYFKLMQKSDGDLHFMIMFDDKVIGHVSLVKHPDDWYETQIIIGEKDYRKKGYGPIAINLLIGWAKRKGISKIFLDVRPTNINAIKAYKKCGFIECGLTKIKDNKNLPETMRMEYRGN